MRLWRYCLAGALFDWLLYVVFTIVPLRAHELGASAVQLGLLQAVSSAFYVTLSVVMGRVADRASRPLLVRIGCAGMIACCLLIARAHSYWTLLAIMPLLGASGTFFWPGVQAAIASESTPERLDRDLGLFNILWSTGKAAGFLTAAALKGRIGVEPTLLLASAGAGAIALFYPIADIRRAPERVEDRADPSLGAALLKMAWIMNFVAYGVSQTIANQYVKLCHERSLSLGGGPELFLGTFLFCAFLSQTAAFVALRSGRGWTYRRAPIHAGLAAMAAGALMMAHVADARLLLLATPLLGAGFGVAYSASIYYSLHTTRLHGASSGVHEAILGSGSFLMPFAAGALATGLGDLRWPYWLCFGVALAASAAAESVYRTRPASAPK